MKSPVAYYLTLLYFAMLCKPVAPLVSDILAHTFTEYEHIRTVHHVNGKDHVHIELREAARENSTENTAAGLKSFDEITFHIPVQYSFSYNKSVVTRHHKSPLTGSLPFIFSSVQLPPPKSLLS